MKFLAKYSPLNPHGKGYWRVIWADSVNEATTRAIRYERKGYRFVAFTEQAA